MRARYGPEVWAGPIVYLIALLGTWLLANDSARALLLISSAVLAVVLWGPPKMDSRVFIRCYCRNASKPQPVVLFTWTQHRSATRARSRPSLCRSAQ